jgi:tetratricopeptide (TPR) repeat protein
MSLQPHSIFISYRRVDSVYAVDQLDERLKLAFGADAVFRDASSISPGAVFPERIRRALDAARVALVVVGPGWLRATTEPSDIHSPRRLDDPADWVRIEIETLLGRGDAVSVIPVLLGGATVPRAADLPAALAAFPNRNGVKLPPFPDFADSLRQLVEAVGKLLHVTPRPFAPVSEVVEEQPRFGGNGFTVTGKQFVGREQELYLLDEAWSRAQREDKINIVSLIGQGGEGKSALVLEWQARRARHGWQGARRVFEWSFYSQGTSAQSSASADDFFNAAFAWFDKTEEVPRDSATKGAKLAELIASQRTLLILDGTEPLQQPPGGFGGEFKEPAMKALLRGLARHNPGLCIVTSRTDITDLSAFEHAGGSCLRHPLHSLDPGAARALLRELGVLGADPELDEAAEWFHRHAYDLNLLGNYLAKCTPDHDIRGWQQRFPILKEDEKIHDKLDANGKRAGHGVRMLRAYERWLEPQPVGWREEWLPSWLGGGKPVRSPALAILRLLGLFDRPVRSDLLDELRAAPVIPGLTEALVSLPDDEWLLALDQLQGLALINRETLSISAERPRHAVSYTLDTHPLLRKHFGAELREKHKAAWREGHRRLYAYLCATTEDKPDATLEDLQPLYQAVAHGCHAGMQQEACEKVYRERIVRGAEFYSTRKLGALGSDLGAVACFFETAWSSVSTALTEVYQVWLLAVAAFNLRALGRVTEALDPMRAGLKGAVRLQDWENAARYAGNVSELELTLGDVGGAEGDAEQSVTYADRSGDAFLRMAMRATHADALHQAGRRDEAEARFREAEQMQAERQSAYPLLHSLPGFKYCDLLLSKAEREAEKTEGERKKDELLALCRAVAERTAKTLKWVIDAKLDLLSIALDHLTQGRAALYVAILQSRSRQCEMVQTSPPTTSEESQRAFTTAATKLDDAVSGLRRASAQHHLPRGLLTRAWLRSLTGPRIGSESAQSDLDEAWEIAERGPMPLFLADIHLYRARLFFREATYPWQSPQHDLAEARPLIFKHGYLRRKEELEDAEAALKHLGNAPAP